MDKRVKFDFEIEFTNGGGIQGQGFRLDIEGDTISDKDLADYIVKDMRLLMVAEVRILNKEIFTEKHKRRPDDNPSVRPTFVDLSHTIADGLVTYKGLPAPIICDYLSREKSRENYAAGTEFQIGKIEMVANTGTYVDCPFHRYERAGKWYWGRHLLSRRYFVSTIGLNEEQTRKHLTWLERKVRKPRMSPQSRLVERS